MGGCSENSCRIGADISGSHEAFAPTHLSRRRNAAHMALDSGVAVQKPAHERLAMKETKAFKDKLARI